ncbi:SH3 domain-binding glutamic acid-rich-like protein 3 isoform X1 [Hemitrygon akajei]|uniref:SH3 domain-binding glutamic acid-rich-like protein 3 isoform X1 n=1 Tax=Hemitrygon akajei TaxID=2704970 RepID=UPI003BF9C187
MDLVSVTALRLMVSTLTLLQKAPSDGAQAGVDTFHHNLLKALNHVDVKSQQSEVARVLDSKGIQYEMIDIAQNNSLKEEMRSKSGNPSALPPQIFNGDQHCGGYEDFVEAVETSDVRKFLKLD